LELSVALIDSELIEGGLLGILDRSTGRLDPFHGLLPPLLLARGRRPAPRWCRPASVAFGRRRFAATGTTTALGGRGLVRRPVRRRLRLTELWRVVAEHALEESLLLRLRILLPLLCLAVLSFEELL